MNLNRIFALPLLIAMLFSINLNTAIATEGSSEYYPVNYDDNITFTMTDNHDGTVTAQWSKYDHPQDFTYYKLVRSQINYDPVYPEDGYIFYSSDINTTSYTDKDIPEGKSYYRVCHIAEQYRYCSKLVLEVDTAGATDTTTADTGEDTEYQYDLDSGDEIAVPTDDSSDTTPTPTTYSGTTSFSDLPATHWATSCVEKLVDKGIVSGNPDGTFKPDRNVNRAEFTKMLILSFYPDLKNYSDKGCFNDVYSTDWFAPYVCAAKSEGIVEGYGGNVFYPANNMSRAEAVAGIVKALKLPVSETLYEIFTDVTTIWQIQYVNTAHKYGLVSGYSDNTFHPDDIIARSEAAQLICNAIDKDISDFIDDDTTTDTTTDDTTTDDTTTDDTTTDAATISAAATTVSTTTTTC